MTPRFPGIRALVAAAVFPAVVYAPAILIVLATAGLAAHSPAGIISVFKPYVLLGIGCGVAWPLVAAVAGRFRNSQSAVPAFCLIGAVVVCLWAIFGYVSTVAGVPTVIGALLGGLVAAHAAAGRVAGVRSRRAVCAFASGLVAVVAGIAFWKTGIQMLWWMPYLRGLESLANEATLYVGALVACAYLWRRRSGNRSGPALVWGAGIVLAVAAACCGFANSWAASASRHHHWGVLVEPAVIVRHGGLLLWDTPAQYGFLSTLAVAAMPFKSTWYSLYVLDGIFLVAGTLVLWAVLQAAGDSPTHKILSALVAFAVVMILPGLYFAGEGPQVYPSTGPFRFFWCYALVALLVALCRSSNETTTRRLQLAGTLIWLVGVAWSAESAVYVSACWIPAQLLLTARLARDDKRQWLWLALPLVALTALVGIVSVVYLRLLGHSPDWRMFVDYALSFQQGLMAFPFDPYGPGWQLLVAFVTPAVLAVWLIARRGVYHRALPALIGVVGLIWGTSSYFVGRSHPNNVANLLAIQMLTFGICWLVIETERIPRALKGFTVASMAPAMAVAMTILGLTFTNGQFAKRMASPVTQAHYREMTASQEILALTIALGYHRGQPLSWIGEDPVPVASQPFPLDIDEAPRLIPIGPLSATSPLSQDRVFELCDRYAARGPKEGWILVPTQESTMPEFRNAIATYLLSHYTVVRSLSTDHYLMSYCRRK